MVNSTGERVLCQNIDCKTESQLVPIHEWYMKTSLEKQNIEPEAK